MAIKRFERGQSTYTCRNCGKLTRNTKEDEGDCGLCYQCWEIAGDANEVYDGYMTEVDFFAKWGKTVDQYEAEPLN